jgi:hypothetical protein
VNWTPLRRKAAIKRVVRRLLVRIAGAPHLQRELTNLDWLTDWATSEKVSLPRSFRPEKPKPERLFL